MLDIFRICIFILIILNPCNNGPSYSIMDFPQIDSCKDIQKFHCVNVIKVLCDRLEWRLQSRPSDVHVLEWIGLVTVSGQQNMTKDMGCHCCGFVKEGKTVFLVVLF